MYMGRVAKLIADLIDEQGKVSSRIISICKKN